jgi:hypothetical protein
MLGAMEPNLAAQELPALYRAVLDRVGELSAAGHRDQANQVRAAATAIYSRAWDERARRDLLALLQRSRDESSIRESTPADRYRRFIRAT